jgi:hypothetical protein
MTLSLIAVLVSLTTSVCCAVLVVHYDRALRRLLPARVRHRQRSADQPPSLFDVAAALPRHWDPVVHAERGAALAQRLMLALALAATLGLLGVTLLGEMVGH